VIVVFGSINVDLIARVPRLPQPGETLAAHPLQIVPGGKGANQALGAARAGGRVMLFGCVGKDALANVALANLRSAGVELRITEALKAPTGIAMIHVDPNGENSITIGAGANGDARADAIPDSVLTNDCIVVMQNELPTTEVAALARRSHARGARVIFNAAPVTGGSLAMLDDVDVLVVNEQEARALVSSETSSETIHPRDCCMRLATPSRSVVVTCGANGAVFSAGGGPALQMPARRIDIVDTVGAGDAFVASLAVALDRGEAFGPAVREAIAAGALACLGAGAQGAMPPRADIARFVATMQT